MINLEEIKTKLQKDGKYWIAFVGDSLTSSEWVHPNWREIVEYVLQNEMTKFSNDWKMSEWGIKGFNFGYDGATTKDILEKVDLVKSINPDLVIYMIGANDPILGVDLESHVKNINNFLKTFENKIVFSTDINPWNNLASERYLPYVEADKNISFIKFINLFDISDSFPKERIFTFKSEENPEEGIKEGDLDYWHPNQLGNAYIAKVILKGVFDINFDPEFYIQTTLSGEKYPKY